MDFLNKLYESNYFGIGLFAVISFLVITFLVVLFFGKKDEKKRLLQERKLNVHKIQNSFNEVSKAASVEVPISQAPNIPIEPIAPIAPVPMEQPVMPVEPIRPVNFDKPIIPNTMQVPNNNIEPVAPIVSDFTPPVMENPAPIVPPVVPIMDNSNSMANPEPVRVAPTRFEVPPVNQPSVAIEPVKINIPDAEPTPVVKPIINNNPVNNVPTQTQTIIEEPEIAGTYYKPVEADVPEEVKVPSIDFDAIAKSISEELEELEKTTAHEMPTRSGYKEPDNTQFSSVYVRDTARHAANDMDLPKTLDLPTKRDEY